MPYLNYCCEAWGNTCKSRIQPLYILFRTRQLGFLENEDYRSHTRSLFYQWKTFGIYDIPVVNFNSMVFMFKVYANDPNLLPSNLLSFFKSE